MKHVTYGEFIEIKSVSGISKAFNCNKKRMINNYKTTWLLKQECLTELQNQYFRENRNTTTTIIRKTT